MVHIVHVYSSKDWKTTVVRCLLFLLSLTLSFKKKLFCDHQLSNLLSMQLSYIFILYANDIVIPCVQGKVEERKPLLVLFSDEAMKIILSTAA